MNNDLKEKRLAICEQCLLYKIDEFYGPVCNKSKYISPDGTKASYFRKPGWMSGCGCTLRLKTSNPNSHCIINKW